MVVVVSLFSAGALVLLLLAVSVRAAASGRAERVPGQPLVAGRGARFGDATAAQRLAHRQDPGQGLRVVAPTARPLPFREPHAA